MFVYSWTVFLRDCVYSWIGMHQPRGTAMTNDEFVLFDNTGQCMVDHRISAEAYDIPLSHIRVQRVDGQTHEWDVPDVTLRDLMLGPWHGFVGAQAICRCV